MPKRNYNLLMKSLNLPQFNSIQELSCLIGVSESLLYCLSKNTHKYYKEKQIPKKDGNPRNIYMPSYTLKTVQRWILYNILNKITPSNQAMAFRIGREYSCKSNALFHKETRYGLTIDLKNFFDTIVSKRVYMVFSNIGYGEFAATILTNLCTLDGFLPQGAVCSPSLSNLVCLSLDARLNGLCKKRRIRYTRYADDMYFSSDNQDVLKKTVPIIRNIINSEGFLINEKKVHYHTPSNKKQINGITISRNNADDVVIKAKKELKKKIRAEIHKAIFSGDYSCRNHIIGEIMYVNYIEGDFVARINKYISSAAQKITIFPELVEVYNNNLFFSSLSKITVEDLSQYQLKFDDDTEFFEHMSSLYWDRQDYLTKYELHDICKYIDWPPVFECD